MSFIDREDMYALIEGLLKTVWKETLGEEITTPFLRMPFNEAMNRFGSDKPDMRFGLEIRTFPKTSVNLTSRYSPVRFNGRSSQSIQCQRPCRYYPG